MRLKVFIIFTAFILLFWGCGSIKQLELSQNKTLPLWYTTPLKTDKTTLYSTGEGKNRDEAIADALNMMASTLSVSIASQFNSKEVVSEGSNSSYSSRVSNEIQSNVKKLRISQYELLNAQELGFRKYIVLIKSDKKKLFESLKTELNQKFELIDKQLKELQNYNVIKQLNIYKNAKEDVLDVPNNLIVMNVLDNSFDSKNYLYKLNMINSGYDNLLSSVSFSIKADSESKNLISSISHGLGVKKLQIKDSVDDKHVIIFVKSDIQKAASYGFTLARSAIEISVEDNNGSVIGSNKLNITGQSTQNYEAAKEGVAVKLNDMIKKEGIGKVLGLDL
ncbi:MAG: hypothetical protein A2513_09455 [Sulfurimonas sp. RIFOXYD12_FULL_33_39]|uniref:LPP20 family lipoprotein n=1 Tax=unclassified Sulfurimonas TaxID=2623549 RepID=UPI0008B98E54|nr:MULTISPECIES: LPP20 family lipoprotein [unclassified Sulfurimonas]OHE06759.1 MAG: hypothetical protein A3G74_06665 [Sulfurimonas sp. RIFCSPLOWO2_12_FULL_34_6]OHE10678.1 MAG: hypothetical protein A2513_09455 [Sulfurimonas sp. RIFOXYD12_FULL_33_39]OHE13191.1 MAG: hypothetical protein A2530_11045 [Sulfurimonas sp. RIFOXYD2_FULL_34_21]